MDHNLFAPGLTMTSTFAIDLRYKPFSKEQAYNFLGYIHSLAALNTWILLALPKAPTSTSGEQVGSLGSSATWQESGGGGVELGHFLSFYFPLVLI